MQKNESDAINRLVKNERRGIWLALIVVTTLALTLMVDIDMRRTLSTGIAVTIVLAVAWLTRSGSRKFREDVQENRDAVMHDELRQTALASAYKWAFLTMLGALAAFCLSSTVLEFAMPGLMLAALTIALGASVFLALFLLFDQA